MAWLLVQQTALSLGLADPPELPKILNDPVEVERYDADRVILASGIEPGELVIVDGVQFLREQQKVAISKGAVQ